MNGSLGSLLPSSVPSSLSSAVRSPEDERRCAPFSVGDEHAALSRAASPAPIKVLLSTLVGSCPLPGLLWLAEAWSVIIERVSLSVLRDPIPGRRGRGDEKFADHWSVSWVATRWIRYSTVWGILAVWGPSAHDLGLSSHS